MISYHQTISSTIILFFILLYTYQNLCVSIITGQNFTYFDFLLFLNFRTFVSLCASTTDQTKTRFVQHNIFVCTSTRLRKTRKNSRSELPVKKNVLLLYVMSHTYIIFVFAAFCVLFSDGYAY
jgi:hypothetical protein